MRRLTTLTLVCSSWMPACLLAEDRAEIQHALEEKFPASKLTGDHTNLIQAGSPLTLKVSGLFTANSYGFPPGNTYKNGKFHGNKFRLTNPNEHAAPNAQPERMRTFVAGERLWVTKVELQASEVVIDVCSDDIQGSRYRAKVKIPVLQPGETPTVNGVMEKISEVFASN